LLAHSLTVLLPNHFHYQKEASIAQSFAKYAGVIQFLIGALGQFVPGIGSILGGNTGGNIFNMLSGAALGYLGMKGSESAQQTGASAH
jgi:Na+/citrate or Na+/malate symporter